MIDDRSILRLRWRDELKRGPGGTPQISPLFVAEHGPAVRIVDVRPAEEATGAVGYIPGSLFPRVTDLPRLAQTDAESPLVLVCANGERSSELARRLEHSDRPVVAAMEGGLAAWRHAGFVTSRDPRGLLRRTPQEIGETPAAEREPGPWTTESLEKHIGNPGSVRWVKLSSMMAHSRLSCIDGRDQRSVIGAPGGDGGLFLLTLAAVEQVTGRPATEDEVGRGLLDRLDRFGNFYLHTDVDAFEALISSLRADPRLTDSVERLERPEGWMKFLRHPPPEAREALLEHLVTPAHIGCGHLRLMLQHSSEYGIRREAVVSFLAAFFRLWWSGAPEISFTVLPGAHAESAAVNVRLASGVWGLSRIPLISPSSGGRQIFVHHPGVSSYLRRRAVLVLARERQIEGLDRVMEKRLQDSIDELGERQLAATVGRLAEGLPVFDVIFARDGSYEVRRASG